MQHGGNVKPYRWNVRIDREGTGTLGGPPLYNSTRIEVTAEFDNHTDAQEFETKVREMLGEE